jgi:hypothetical protein
MSEPVVCRRCAFNSACPDANLADPEGDEGFVQRVTASTGGDTAITSPGSLLA